MSLELVYCVLSLACVTASIRSSIIITESRCQLSLGSMQALWPKAGKKALKKSVRDESICPLITADSRERRRQVHGGRLWRKVKTSIMYIDPFPPHVVSARVQGGTGQGKRENVHVCNVMMYIWLSNLPYAWSVAYLWCVHDQLPCHAVISLLA